MARWRYVEHCCKSCGQQGSVRMDVNNRLKKEGRSWECKSCCTSRRMRELSKKHGQYGTPAYVSWQKMKDRCLNENHKYFKHYGGRGITIDPKWMQFEGFFEDMGKMPALGYSLDRIDNDLGYCKENCRWIPRRDQPKNRRCSKKPYQPAA